MDLVSYYKKYYAELMDFPRSIEDITNLYEIDNEGYKKLENVEVQIIKQLYENTNELVSADEAFFDFTLQEKHLTFNYVLFEGMEDLDFWHAFLQKKKRSIPFIKKTHKKLLKLEMPWAEQQKWNLGLLDSLGIKTYKTILLNHTLSVLFYFGNDAQKNTDNADAYIEKSTDVLFKISDTSTLFSIIDLSKFLFYNSEVGKYFQQKDHG